MIRDQGPNFQLGSGATTDQMNIDSNIVEGQNPESGIIAKALHDHPVMKFLAVSATTMVGMAVAGGMVRKGGIRLGHAIQSADTAWTRSAVRQTRQIQKHMDAWEGVRRTFADGAKDYDSSKRLYVKDPETGKIIGDHTETLKGWYFTRGEQEAAVRNGIEPVSAWTTRHEIQQRMVKQARRLPYELPAAYITQRALTDKLFGDDENKKKVNWSNPTDIFTDFVTESVKNTAFMIAPFEIGVGAGKQGARNLLTAGDGITNLGPKYQAFDDLGLSLKTILGQVGADADAILNQTIKMSSRVTGSIASAVQESRYHTMDLVTLLDKAKHGASRFNAKGTATRIKNVLQDPTKLSYDSIKQSAKARAKTIDPSSFDIIPGPFSGFGSGIKRGIERYGEIKAAQQQWDDVLKFGPGSVFKGGKKPHLENASLGSHPIEELASDVIKHGRGLDPNSAGFKRSDFFKRQMEFEYKQRLAYELRRNGIDEADIAEFNSSVRMSQPQKGKHLGQRFGIGSGVTAGETDDEVFNALISRAAGVSAAGRTQLKTALKPAVQNVDNIFSNKHFLNSTEAKIKTQWKTFVDDVLAKSGDEVLGNVKLPYQRFAKDTLSDYEKQYLVRKAAQVTGMPLVNKTGKVASDAKAIGRLQSIGMDPTDFDQLRAYLASKNAIGKPWHRDGYNLLGFKELSVSTALNRNYFYGDENVEDTIRNLTNKMSRNDPVSNLLGGYKLKGAYQTASGNIIDTTTITRGIRKGLDSFTNEFGIPFLSFNPLQLTGASARQELRQRSILQHIPGYSKQAFLAGRSNTDDFYMHLRTSRRGSSGKVWAFSSTDGIIKSVKLPGSYKANSPIGGFAARFAKLGAGRSSVEPYPDEPVSPRKAAIRKAFSTPKTNQDSIFGYLARFRSRKTDINNPSVLAKLLRGETINANGKNLQYDQATGTVRNGNNVEYTQHEVAEAFTKFSKDLDTNSLGSAFRGNATKGKEYLDYDYTGLGSRTFAEGKRNLTTLETQDQLIEASQLIIQGDRALTGLPKSILDSLDRARAMLISRHLKQGTGDSYWNSTIGKQAGTSQKRIDVLRDDVYKYLVIRKGLTESSDINSFNDSINTLLTDLLENRTKGLISQAEYTEARAAILSTQIHYANLKTYHKKYSPTEVVGNTIRNLLNSRAGSKDLLDDIGQGYHNLTDSKASVFQPFFKRHFGTAKYEPRGIEYNPFGDNTVLIPTFGTVAEKNMSGALSSVAGLKTWNSPETFSSASMVSSHLFERLNRPLTTMGVGLEAGDFRGPLDFYARGIIGKRVLPAVAGGTTLLGLDATLGGYVNDKDENGDRVYSPLVLGAAAGVLAQGQMTMAGIVPGGQTYGEKKQELLEGEVAVRSGRWWPMGNTPFKGGRIQYYRPSWYRRLKSGYKYTDQTYGTPMERLAFGHDFSPLRPLDPYRFEREHYEERPYPVSGNYFTGPWGPLTSVLNSTIGRVLKPSRLMHEEEFQQGMANYANVGQSGAFLPSSTSGSSGQVVSAISSSNMEYAKAGMQSPRSAAVMTSRELGQINESYSAAGAISPRTAANATVEEISNINAEYSQAGYGTPKRIGTTSSMDPRIVSNEDPISAGSMKYQSSQLGYELQELFGIYGFASATLRSSLGLGSYDLSPSEPVMESADRAYGSTRSFWDLNIGGLGDVPTPFDGSFSNIEFSELIRRFIPKRRTDVDYINPIANKMGQEHPWLPGSNYYVNFHDGDPYTEIQEGEMRLPGKGYERFNNLHSDEYGEYGIVDRHKILGDVAPWSQEYRQVDTMIDSMDLASRERELIERTREQVEAKATIKEFTPYEYKYMGWKDRILNPIDWSVGRTIEKLAHGDTYMNTKFMPTRTAVEDWERDNVYGATFPQWQTPVQSFIEPAIDKATQRNPIAATGFLSAIGTMFGKTHQARVIGGVIGGTIGLAASLWGKGYKAVTGERFIPKERKEQIALEEYTDILSYMKYTRGMEEAKAIGDSSAFSAYQKAAQTTMYGADIYNGDLSQIAMAIPKRKREHFRAMLSAPEQERDQILSTSGRLERRILQAAWGRPVEKRPDLEEYFSEHELPDASWEGYHPNTNMDHVKIKIGQSLGIDMAQMGYYPQQVREANRVNMSYPDFRRAPYKGNTETQIRNLLYNHGLSGDVVTINTPYGGDRLQISGGMR